MVKNTDPKYTNIINKLEKLRADAIAIAVEIDAEFGPIGGWRQVMDGEEAVQTQNGEILLREYESESFYPIAIQSTNLTRLGMLLDNSATNLGLWEAL